MSLDEMFQFISKNHPEHRDRLNFFYWKSYGCYEIVVKSLYEKHRNKASLDLSKEEIYYLLRTMDHYPWKAEGVSYEDFEKRLETLLKTFEVHKIEVVSEPIKSKLSDFLSQ